MKTEITNEEFHQKIIGVLQPLFKEIVDFPDGVSLSVYQGEQTAVFEIKVQKEDLGKIIGKDGKMARALRMILHSLASKYGRRAVLEIVQ